MGELLSWFNGQSFFTVIVEWFCCVCYVLRMEEGKKKRKGWKLGILCVSMFLAQSVVVYVLSSYGRVESVQQHLIWLCICMPVYVAFMWIFLFMCCEGSKLYLSCVCIKAFLFSELAWSLNNDIVSKLYVNSQLQFQWLAAVVVLGSIFVGIHTIEKLCPVERESDITWYETFIFAGICIATFWCATLFFGFFYEYFGEWVNISHTAADLIGIFCIYEYQMRVINKKMQQELLMISKVMEEQSNQYRALQENIDVINQKYHDMKHMCFLIKNGSARQNMAWLDEIENDIQNFEAIEKTGNHVIDTILTDKHLYCIRHNIELTSVIDGKQLAEMSEVDICTIFGNVLSNAIECVEQIKKVEKRLIHICVFEKQGFLNMSFDNIIEQEVQIVDGLPITTKREKEIHGYGLKSVRYTVEKYGGHMTIHVNENWFQLKILIPMPLARKDVMSF